MALTLEDLVARFAETLASQIVAGLLPVLRQVPNGSPNYAPQRNLTLTKVGYKRDMRCRAPRCFQRSKGPRFGYLCEKHLDAPKGQKEKWIEEYRSTHLHAA